MSGLLLYLSLSYMLGMSLLVCVCHARQLRWQREVVVFCNDYAVAHLAVAISLDGTLGSYICGS